MNRLILKMCDKMKILVPVLTFLWATYVVFAPSSLLLSNITEFQMHYIYILPTLIIVSIFVLGCANLIGVLLGHKLLPYYVAILFGLTFSMYIQFNFLNPSFRVLDGARIDWGKYSNYNVISILVWIAILLGVLFFVYIKKELCLKVIKVISFFMSGVQLLTLVFLIIVSETGADSYGRFAFTKEDQFSIGTEKNVVVFVLDSLQVEAMEQYSAKHAEELEDFTFFTNTVSGGAPTPGAMPILLTGIEYDPMQSRNQYEADIWNQTNIYTDLRNAGYNIKVFTSNLIIGMPEGYLEEYQKISTAVVSNHRMFIKNMYSLVNFMVFPQNLKKYFVVSTEDITDNIGILTLEKNLEDIFYEVDDVKFYTELQDSELDLKYQKAFRLYHLDGAHPPFVINNNMERVEEATSESQQIEGVMLIVYSYMEKLQEEGLYDNTTIVITGDHGQHENGNLMVNPAILVKRADEQHELEYNDNPVCFRNLVATIMEQACGEYFAYGPELYDITMDSDVERLHTFPTALIDEEQFNIDDCWNDKKWYRIAIDQEGRMSTWNPYDRNAIEYALGEEITFNNSNIYSDKITERVYRQEDHILLSNEFTMCFNMKEKTDVATELELQIAKVYNGCQNARIYINGNYLQDVAFTEDMVGSTVRIEIPADEFSDVMVMRMVFPGAVTPHMLNQDDDDMRVLSIGIDEMCLSKK